MSFLAPKQPRPRKGSVFTEVRLPSGKVQHILDQDVYERALAAAKAVMNRNAIKRP